MDIIDKVIAMACSLMGTNEQQLFSTNMEEYVDTRALIFTTLFSLGMTDKEMAHRCNVSRQCVNKLRNGFRERMRKWSVRHAYKEINQKISIT